MQKDKTTSETQKNTYGKSLQEEGMGKDFSVSDTKTSEKKPKNGQISLYQVTEFCLFVFTVKEPIRMVKRQLTD